MSDPAPAQLVPPDERILLDIRPGVLSILLRPAMTVGAVVLLGAGAGWGLDVLSQRVGRGDPDLSAALNRLSAWAIVLGIAFGALRLLWEAAFWWSCRFVLTERRAIRWFGVFGRQVADLPLRNVQHLTGSRSIGERLLGLGTVGILTGGGAFPEVRWWMVPRPQEVLATIREQVERAGAAASPATAAPAPPRASPAPATERPLVIGLVGGVGAGKSAVAEELAALGALVIDSDKEARAALQTPAVREELVKWWGPGVLTPDGAVDRSAVASIVFADPGARARLEALVHPLVKATRARLIGRAAAVGKRIVVVDAPLLFEAGVDKECDEVVFVEAPESARLARVRASRGWDESELRRREKAQLPLEAKRERADDVVVNDAGREALATRVRDLLERIQGRTNRRETAAAGRQ